MRSLAEAMSFPGIDPRTWFSIATVDADAPEFDEDLGYLVPVTLQPTQVQGYAMCMHRVAGDGESDHEPFVEGDTLVVGVLHGMERAGVIVLGRMNSNRAPPPSKVAGQDATANNSSWRKSRPPHLEEYGDRWTIRQAKSEALLNVDAAGTWTIRDGGKGALQMSSDVFSYTSGDSTMNMQFDLAATRFSIQCGEAVFALSSLESITDLPMSMASVLSVPGSLQLAAAGNLAGEHAATIEGYINFQNWFMTVYQAAITAATGTLEGAIQSALAPALSACLGTLGAGLGPFAAGWAAALPGAITTFTTAMTTALSNAMAAYTTASNPAAMAGFIVSAIQTASHTPQNPTIAPALYSALLSQPPKQVPAVPPQGQVQPGLGSAGILIG